MYVCMNVSHVLDRLLERLMSQMGNVWRMYVHCTAFVFVKMILGSSEIMSYFKHD